MTKGNKKAVFGEPGVRHAVKAWQTLLRLVQPLIFQSPNMNTHFNMYSCLEEVQVSAGVINIILVCIVEAQLKWFYFTGSRSGGLWLIWNTKGGAQGHKHHTYSSVEYINSSSKNYFCILPEATLFFSSCHIQILCVVHRKARISRMNISSEL